MMVHVQTLKNVRSLKLKLTMAVGWLTRTIKVFYSVFHTTPIFFIKKFRCFSDASVYANLIKVWFRDLPESVLTSADVNAINICQTVLKI